MSVAGFDSALAKVMRGEALDAAASAQAFEAIMSGRIAQEDLANFLRALSMRGPTVPEILGAARVMRARMTSIAAPPGAVDLCGTGGDGKGTRNISTAVSFVVAASGVLVAKHGNRNMSSKTGAADVLEALGARIDLAPDAAAGCLHDIGLCFLFAQTYHPAMKHVAEVRRQIGMRTIFNLLGPLSNPAGVRRQLIGVYAKEWVRPVAEVLRALGTEHAWVVHGGDGMDEITTTDMTHVAVLSGGTITGREVTPEDAGLSRAAPDALKGGTARENADALVDVLGGAPGAYRDIVLINAAAVLMVAGKATDLREGTAIAADAVDSGRAAGTLKRFIAATTA